MIIRRASEEKDAQDWEQFVTEHLGCSNYHRWGWKRAIENSFHWPTFYLMAEDAGRICGILPLVWQKSRIFGNFLTSLPFLNCGGVIAENQVAKEDLVGEAILIARQKKVDYVELRQRANPELNLLTKTHKIAMVLPLEPSSEAMWAALPHKVRTDIRKSMKSGLAAEFGGQESLDIFYDIFAKNMRDLGTPVYGRKLFSEIFKAFPNDSYICVVRHQGKPVAVSFLSEYRGTIEALWSSSLYDFAALKPNMFLYWSILCFAGQKGFRFFDFGRSSVDSGTYRFKKQWGSQEVPLHWVYWVPDGATLPEVNNKNPRYQLAIRLWQKLPLSVTKLVGPAIVKRLP
jgi:serine/alanine adding enzyme